MELNPRLLANIKFERPSQVQRKSLQKTFAGKDVMCISKTGSGKTLIYILTALQRGKKTLVVVPTKELAEQIKTQFTKYTKGLDTTVEVLYGNMPVVTADIMIGTPGKMKMLEDFARFELIVFDECDKTIGDGVLREHFEEIRKKIIHKTQWIFVSATFSMMLYRYVCFLDNLELVRIDDKINEGIDNKFIFTTDESKIALLLYIVEEYLVAVRKENEWQEKTKKFGEKIIVFCSTRKIVELVYECLRDNMKKVELYHIHSEMADTYREETMYEYRMSIKKDQIMVTTDLGARGLDIKNLDHLVMFDFCSDISTFIHRIGRIGRGKKGNIFSSRCFVTHNDLLFFTAMKHSPRFDYLPPSFFDLFLVSQGHIDKYQKELKTYKEQNIHAFRFAQLSREKYIKTCIKPLNEKTEHGYDIKDTFASKPRSYVDQCIKQALAERKMYDESDNEAVNDFKHQIAQYKKQDYDYKTPRLLKIKKKEGILDTTGTYTPQDYKDPFFVESKKSMFDGL